MSFKMSMYRYVKNEEQNRYNTHYYFGGFVNGEIVAVVGYKEDVRAFRVKSVTSGHKQWIHELDFPLSFVPLTIDNSLIEGGVVL